VHERKARGDKSPAKSFNEKGQSLLMRDNLLGREEYWAGLSGMDG